VGKYKYMYFHVGTLNTNSNNERVEKSEAMELKMSFMY